MSHEGKLRRGKKWSLCRDKDGNLVKGVADDSNKMADVNYYLDSLKSKAAVPAAAEPISHKKGRR